MTAVKHHFLAALTAISMFYPAIAPAVSDTPPQQHRFINNIEKKENIKIVYDVKEDIWEAGVGKALYFMRGLLASYASLGIPQEQLHISIIMHGPTAYWLLNETAFQNHTNDPFGYNPNENIVSVLLSLGVSVEICNATMKAKGWSEKDLLPSVTIVHDAYTRLIDLQLRNYTYIKF